MTDSLEIRCTADEGATLPSYKTEGAAGADICAFVKEPILIEPGKTQMIPTGLHFEIPVGYEIQVRPRSGLAAKNSVTVLNTPGTIDSDYRGEVKVILINLGNSNFTISNGDRIAQLVVAPVVQGKFCRAESLSQTERGTGGFGSTGVSVNKGAV
jgi:dUTP pyrophosphatase